MIQKGVEAVTKKYIFSHYLSSVLLKNNYEETFYINSFLLIIICTYIYNVTLLRAYNASIQTAALPKVCLYCCGQDDREEKDVEGEAGGQARVEVCCCHHPVESSKTNKKLLSPAISLYLFSFWPFNTFLDTLASL